MQDVMSPVSKRVRRVQVMVSTAIGSPDHVKSPVKIKRKTNLTDSPSMDTLTPANTTKSIETEISGTIGIHDNNEFK